jgi:hypothetical protein
VEIALTTLPTMRGEALMRRPSPGLASSPWYAIAPSCLGTPFSASRGHTWPVFIGT